MKGNNVGPAAGSTGNMGVGTKQKQPNAGPTVGGGNMKAYSPKPNHGVSPGQNLPVKNDVSKGGSLPSKK